MKTKLVSVDGWETLLSRIGYDDSPDGHTVEEYMRKELSRGHTTFDAAAVGTRIESGFRVTLQSQSKLPKYNREKTVVTVGNGLYDRDIEKALVGMAVGDEKSLVVKGERVDFCVVAVEQKSYPPFTDELVKELSFDGVETLAQYREYCEKKLKNEYADALCERLTRELVKTAVTDGLADADVIAVTDREYDELRVRFSLDTISPEEWKESFENTALKAYYAQIYPDIANLFGTTDKASYYASRREDAVNTVMTCLVLRNMLGTYGDDTDPTKTKDAKKRLGEMARCRLLNIIYGGN